MKIAIDIRDAGGEKTGKGWYTFNLVQALLRLDKKNDYLLYTKALVPGFEEFDNVVQKIVEYPTIFWHTATARDLKQEMVDVFFAPTSLIIPSIISKEIKCIVTIHDLVALLFPSNHNKKAVLIEKMLLGRAVKKADKILAVSSNTKQDLIEKFQLDESKIEVVYASGSESFQQIEDPEMLENFRLKTNLPEKFFLAVGTIEPRKNYPNLIKAFAEFSKKYPKYRLIIVGRDGWQFEETYKAIHENYMQKKVHFLGYLSEKSIVNLYNMAEAFVFPSLYEGFGIPPLDAMRCGCPVIAANTSSLPEVVGNAGILIDPKNPHSITAAMLKIVENKELRDTMVQNGFAQAKKFSWEASAKRLLEIIKKI